MIRAMRSLTLAIALAACSGPAASTTPHGRPSVRLVGCAAATPRPLVSEAVVASTVSAGSPWQQRKAKPTVVEGSGFDVGKRASVSLGTPTVTGALATAKVVARVKLSLPELNSCYARDQSNASPAKSAVVYRMTVDSSGQVTGTDVSTQVLSPNLDACVRRVLRLISFGAPPVAGASTVSYPIVFDSTTIPVARPVEPGGNVDPWTPFALLTSPAAANAAGAARVAEAAVRTRLEAIEKCFAGPTPTGSLRAMLEIDLMGELGTVRIGGLGDVQGEACVAKALVGLHVIAPKPEAVEVACDLARGDAQAWRVAPSAGYGVIEAEHAKLHHDADTVLPGTEPDPLPSKTYLVVARGDASGAMLQLALAWANDADAVLVAMHDGTAAPIFLALGHTSASHGDDSLVTETSRAALRVGAKLLTGCVNHATHEAKLSDGAAVGALVQRLATRCRTLHCAQTLLVSMDGDAVARDLVEITGAARRAGFERVLLGGTELACDAPPPTKPRPKPTQRRPPIDID